MIFFIQIDFIKINLNKMSLIILKQEKNAIIEYNKMVFFISNLKQ